MFQCVEMVSGPLISLPLCEEIEYWKPWFLVVSFHFLVDQVVELLQCCTKCRAEFIHGQTVIRWPFKFDTFGVEKGTSREGGFEYHLGKHTIRWCLGFYARGAVYRPPILLGIYRPISDSFYSGWWHCGECYCRGRTGSVLWWQFGDNVRGKS